MELAGKEVGLLTSQYHAIINMKTNKLNNGINFSSASAFLKYETQLLTDEFMSDCDSCNTVKSVQTPRKLPLSTKACEEQGARSKEQGARSKEQGGHLIHFITPRKLPLSTKACKEQGGHLIHSILLFPTLI
ncbi:hypothetical protein Dsin_011972 [Dipteronia sinensis]|uniref:Uncharacterized protein n=1 Tax=Dipteronia sinensis TaxID=43782 RepID=A0AAE0E815_9ROSI|nr:hypothetical protein Dsin_011972 [Dipteronia sinensis]